MPDFRRPVVETLVRSGLNLDECLVVGGAVIAMHGLSREPRDVDVGVALEVFGELLIQGQTPAGVVLMAATNGLHSHVLEQRSASTSLSLPLHIVPFVSAEGLSFSDELVRSTSHQSEGGVIIHTVGLRTVLDRKLRGGQRPKDITDIQLIRQHLAVIQ